MTFLNQEYPFLYKNGSLIKITGFVFVFIIAFIVLFQPFNFYNEELKYNFIVTALIYGFIDCLVFFFYFLTCPKIFQRYFTEENWTIAKEISTIATLLILIGVVNFLVRDITNNLSNNFTFKFLLDEILHTFLIGIIIEIVFTSINFYYLLNKHTKKANQLNTIIEPKNPHYPIIIDFKAKNNSERFSTEIDNLYFIKSDGNYLEFHVNENNEFKTYILRDTLTNVEQQFENYDTLIRTHRSFIVNINNVRNVKGNARGYTIYFDKYENNAFISRSYIAKVDSLIYKYKKNARAN